MLTSALLHAPFYFYVSYGMIRYLFHDDRVTTDELYATGAAFTVVAWGFAYVFVACAGDLAGLVRRRRRQRRRTRSSTCCSCRSPTSPASACPTSSRCCGHARSLVMIEQVAGVLYVALVVARLVGLTVARQANRNR